MNEKVFAIKKENLRAMMIDSVKYNIKAGICMNETPLQGAHMNPAMAFLTPSDLQHWPLEIF